MTQPHPFALLHPLLMQKLAYWQDAWLTMPTRPLMTVPMMTMTMKVMIESVECDVQYLEPDSLDRR